MRTGNTIPVARQLDLIHSCDLSPVFDRLRMLPHCLWLDSASDNGFDRGRYSFLTADPVAWCSADMDSPNPWPVLHEWCRKLQHLAPTYTTRSDEATAALPPFWGGIAGLLAYESAWWLEPTLRHDPKRHADSTTPNTSIPGLAIGLYDWTIAADHQLGQAWLLSTGLSETFELDPDRANHRADQVMRWIEGENTSLAGNDTKPFTGAGQTGRQAVTSNFTDESFAAGVQDIVERIHGGDSFQVNLAQTLSHPATCGSAELYGRLRRINPAPYAGYFNAGEYQVISSSPEGFLQVRIGSEGERTVVTRPIKGTVAKTGDETLDTRLGAELLASEKDRAENIMIVDLMRNDLSRVCTDASVEVTKLCELERYQRVQHLVSTVRGVLDPDATVADLLAACFPGGSITGAPKVEAMRTIAELENRSRGPYCGSLGYVSLSGAADFNILIRTVTQRRTSSGASVWDFPVGGGITARSDPKRETEETWVKAASLLEAITSAG
ncbi:anthranilate synthase component I family protein [Aporhodopirellula aestuarii]|uniref:Anthranilate synthase component I family protein n=1 Tax=Aporhodopirellula aestuarii TaxID=2950107 RepID=A0ABT0TZJ8_9BACT|nr:anthranilate synthase component I family protein [Aporhodopirellula aestuarii]MCM2370037.1 anthranilate synthase component I family protein [Aporhodopirellula aestuarii]